MATTATTATPGTRRRASSATSASVHGGVIAPGVEQSPAYARGILRTLGIVGLDAVEPVILAALATEAPLLLVGPHGTAKSLLLGRLCEALGLEWRHYNASLLNYDDLVGYPLPDAEGRLRFIETPASIWGAEAVFLDEISRCRPDMQNRLFPVVHERKVQGLPLPRLRYRWAAMNPPARRDAIDDDPYAGSLPLDDALADRFPLIVGLPSFADMTTPDRDAVIRQRLEPVSPEVSRDLCHGIAAIRERIPVVEASCGALFTRYVDAFASLAAEAGWSLSGRRATMLFGNLVAVTATVGPSAGASTSATTWAALRGSIPTVATGRGRIEDAKLRVIHEEAWNLSGMTAADPRRALLAERDPVRRAVLAVSLPVDRQVRSATVADALATLPPGARHALAFHLAGTEGIDLYPAVAEEVANLVAEATVLRARTVRVNPNTPKYAAGKRITRILERESTVASDTDLEGLLALLPNLFAEGVLRVEADVDACTARWASTRADLRSGTVTPTGSNRARSNQRGSEGGRDATVA